MTLPADAADGVNSRVLPLRGRWFGGAGIALTIHRAERVLGAAPLSAGKSRSIGLLGLGIVDGDPRGHDRLLAPIGPSRDDHSGALPVSYVWAVQPDCNSQIVRTPESGSVASGS